MYTDYATAEELGKLWVFKPSTIRAWAKMGKIPGAVKVGRTWRFSLAEAKKCLVKIEPKEVSIINDF